MVRWGEEGIEEVTKRCAEKIVNMIRVEELYHTLQDFRNLSKEEERNEQILQATKDFQENSPGQSPDFGCRLGDGEDRSSNEAPIVPGRSIGGISDGQPSGSGEPILGIFEGGNWSL